MIGEIEIPQSFPSPGSVEGKRVVITGASRGLGALLAHAFSAAGASVALVARTERDLKAVAEVLPGPYLVLSGDVTDEDCNEGVADATVAEWGGVDAWICNAGISPIVAGPRQTDASVWRQILEVNLTGSFLGARAAARVMGEGGRLTVNVVAPGWFDSPLADGWKNDPKLSAAITGHTAQRRWGAPADLTGAYLFLVSEAAAFVTGTVLNVDGGYLLV
jgi:NAD(P)-dependent dehydrogenase (short-subunit alcohol dehydrogenase family)